MNGPKDAATSDWKSWPAAKATPTHRWQPNHNTSPNSRTQHENQPPGPRGAHRPRTPRPPLLTHPPTRRATDRLHHSTGLDPALLGDFLTCLTEKVPVSMAI